MQTSPGDVGSGSPESRCSHKPIVRKSGQSPLEGFGSSRDLAKEGDVQRENQRASHRSQRTEPRTARAEL